MVAAFLSHGPLLPRGSLKSTLSTFIPAANIVTLWYHTVQPADFHETLSWFLLFSAVTITESSTLQRVLLEAPSYQVLKKKNCKIPLWFLGCCRKLVFRRMQRLLLSQEKVDDISGCSFFISCSVCLIRLTTTSLSWLQFSSTVFTRISAVALIKFFAPQVRCLFEGGAYLREALIKNLDGTKNLIF